MTAAEEGHEVDQLRVVAQARLEVAVGEGRLTLEEYSDKAAVVWSPTADRALLAQIVPYSADPPAAVSPPQSTIVGVFGDTKRSGRWSLATKTLALMLFGDVKFDLRSATITAHSSTITVVSIFGDTSVVVPEGVSVELGGFELFGDREFDGGRQDAGPGAPVIRVVSYSLFGDLKVRAR
ncbi:LiaF domain-containing protein [Rhodococcus sp. OK302]|uniref:LiaF domain-containing protein n=1 Tax=Rhodococcus sp. OK302 TaxID=1882769 RepID=UPI000B93B648|nr:LiaF domain-containing protein [Rhodococcus sp. OK302]OYD61316.1 cell wall-active antibiotic response 4TMS protein YvqF [Rhodococcus sp. OK302]